MGLKFFPFILLGLILLPKTFLSTSQMSDTGELVEKVNSQIQAVKKLEGLIDNLEDHTSSRLVEANVFADKVVDLKKQIAENDKQIEMLRSAKLKVAKARRTILSRNLKKIR